MPGPKTLDDIREVNADLKDVEREVRDFRNDVSRATNDQNQKIHAVELEVRGASGKLDLIFLAQTDHETRIRVVERSVLKFAVWAGIIGAILTIIGTQVVRKVIDTQVPQSLVEKYLDDGRKKTRDMQEENEAWKHRANSEGSK